MSYRALVSSNVTKAFRLLKDLAEDVTLTKRASSTFDFATQTATIVDGTPIVTKAVVTDTAKSSQDRSTAVKVAMLKNSEVGDVGLYDKVTYQGADWKIGPIITSDSFVTVVELHKEISNG
jgi:hypothetical protein